MSQDKHAQPQGMFQRFFHSVDLRGDGGIFAFFGAETFPLAFKDGLLSLGFLVFMLLTRQAKWRGRDILELAARPVAGEAEAYSNRPRPVGKADYTAAEILDFAAYARRRLIAMTYVEQDRVVFVPVKMGTEYGFLFRGGRDYSGDTWVAFGNDGHITVNVSESDYSAFREDLDHDQLCRSLADVFLDFLDMHRKGQDGRILDRLDAMKIGVFS